MHDLKQLTDTQFTADEAKLIESTSKHYITILVEGKSDAIFYRKLLAHQCIFTSSKNKQEALEVLQKRNEDSTSLTIAILDADFDRITNKNSNISNLFFADYHDKEVMLFSSNTVLEAVLNEFGIPSKIQAIEKKHQEYLSNILLKITQEVAFFRLLNELEEEITLTFRIQKSKKYSYLNYSSFINSKTLVLDFAKLCKAIENKSSQSHLFSKKPVYLDKINTLKSSNYSILELCNGHDLMNILSLAFQEALGNKKNTQTISGEALESYFSFGYRLDDFKTTVLYKDLDIWQDEHNVSLLRNN
jgi:hypothetical protein